VGRRHPRNRCSDLQGILHREFAFQGNADPGVDSSSRIPGPPSTVLRKVTPHPPERLQRPGYIPDHVGLGGPKASRSMSCVPGGPTRTKREKHGRLQDERSRWLDARRNKVAPDRTCQMKLNSSPLLLARSAASRVEPAASRRRTIVGGQWEPFQGPFRENGAPTFGLSAVTWSVPPDTVGAPWLRARPALPGADCPGATTASIFSQ